MSATLPSVADAYRHCEALTREQAGNFYYGIRLLPAPKRRAMCAVYAFARLVDDIGDGDQPAERKLELLADARAQLETEDGSPTRIALADAERRFALPREALCDLIDGVEMDVRGTEYETFDELVVYCRRVAGSIGRLCLAIFGSSDMATASPLADDLGVAMQLTNILRDVREDLEAAAPAQFAGLMAFEAQRAREWFARGLALVDLIDARSASCVCAMTGIYRRILDRIDESPHTVLDHRLSLATWEKTWVALRSLAGASR